MIKFPKIIIIDWFGKFRIFVGSFAFGGYRWRRVRSLQSHLGIEIVLARSEIAL